MGRTVRAILSAAVLSTAALLTVQANAHAALAVDTAVHTIANHAATAQIDAYWTPQRLANAKPMTADPSAVTARASVPVQGLPRYVPSIAPKGAALGDKAGSVTAAAAPSEWVTIGRLFFSIPGNGDWVCSGNVVASNNRDVIATARHCVMNISTGQTYTSFHFAPSYNQGNAPYGWWNWRSMGWRVDDTSPGGDNAFIVMSTGGNSGGHIVDAVGGSGLGFNWATNNYAHAIGLPASLNYAVWCEGMPYDGPSGGVQIPNCNGLSGGASGGAFIVNYQTSDGSAMQTATYFGTWGDSYFAYYRDAAYQVWAGAQGA
jgi:V8-like Glu-specific endopeptidase